MADDLIQCPACDHQLRLPAELYGREVECPQCHGRFVAPVPRGTAPPPVLLPAPPPEYAPAPGPTYADDPEALAHRAAASLKAPAAVLLVLAGLGVLLGAYLVAHVDDTLQEVRRMARDPDLPPQLRDFFQKAAANLDADTVRTSHLIYLAQHVLTFLGAVQMLRLRGYWLAVLGCVAALNPVNCPCCLLEAPFGLWGLIVLLNPAVRAAFR